MGVFSSKKGSQKRKETLDSIQNLAKSETVMLGQSPHQAQTDLFKNLLAHQLNPQHPLYLLGQAIPWKKLEEVFAPLYGQVGLPSHPIRKMGCPAHAQTPLQPQR